MEELIRKKEKIPDNIVSKIYDESNQESKFLDNNEPKIKIKNIKSKKSILKKDSRIYAGQQKQEKSLGIKWDNKAIDEQNDYRKKHRLSNAQLYKIKSLSRTKFNSNVIGEDDDQYLKNLIKVNEIKVTDELIKNIIKKLQRPKEDKISRNHSTILKTPYKFELYSNSNSSSTDNLDVFDDILDDEKKITLQNTIINKFHKEVLEEFQN